MEVAIGIAVVVVLALVAFGVYSMRGTSETAEPEAPYVPPDPLPPAEPTPPTVVPGARAGADSNSDEANVSKRPDRTSVPPKSQTKPKLPGPHDTIPDPDPEPDPDPQPDPEPGPSPIASLDSTPLALQQKARREVSEASVAEAIGSERPPEGPPTVPDFDLRRDLPSGFVPEKTVPDPPPAEDWPGAFLEAAAEVAESGDPDAMKVFQTRFEQVDPCPDPDMQEIFQEDRAADFLLYLAVQAEDERPGHALTLARAAAVLEPDNGEIHGSAALIALRNLTETPARHHAERALALTPDKGRVIEMYVSQVFRPASDAAGFVPHTPPMPPKDVAIVRDAPAIRRALGEIYGRLIVHRKVCLDAGAPPDAAWLATPPESWQAPLSFENEVTKPLDHAKANAREWTAARVLCEAVGWTDLEPRDDVEPVDLKAWLAWAEYQVWFSHDMISTGGNASLVNDFPEVEWRGVRLAGLNAIMADTISTELVEVLAFLRWLVDDRASSVYDDLLRQS